MMSDDGERVQQSTRGHDAMPGDRDGVQTSEVAAPRALLASGVPRIVILDENSVYDHYMRRLNRVWMRRIKVGGVSAVAAYFFATSSVDTALLPYFRLKQHQLGHELECAGCNLRELHA